MNLYCLMLSHIEIELLLHAYQLHGPDSLYPAMKTICSPQHNESVSSIPMKKVPTDLPPFEVYPNSLLSWVLACSAISLTLVQTRYNHNNTMISIYICFVPLRDNQLEYLARKLEGFQQTHCRAPLQFSMVSLSLNRLYLFVCH